MKNPSVERETLANFNGEKLKEQRNFIIKMKTKQKEERESKSAKGGVSQVNILVMEDIFCNEPAGGVEGCGPYVSLGQRSGRSR